MDEIAPPVSGTTREEIIRRAKRAVAKHYGVAPRLLGEPTKARHARWPRCVAMYLVYRATPLPLAGIGRAFGLRSHSSASRAIQQVRERRERDPAFERTVDDLLGRM